MKEVEKSSIAENEIKKLSEFLLKKYPQEIGRGNPEYGESAVDVAVRLLYAFGDEKWGLKDTP